MPLNLKNTLITFFVFAVIRLLFESFFSISIYAKNFLALLPNFFVEFGTYFLTFILFAALFYWLTFKIKKQNFDKSTLFLKSLKTVIWIWPFIILPPILNAIFLGSAARPLTNYLFVSSEKVLGLYLNLFGPPGQFGVTLGMKISFLAAALAAGFYFAFISKKLWLGFLASTSLYSIIFFYTIFPVFLTFIYKLPNLGAVTFLDLADKIISVTPLLGIEASSSLAHLNLTIGAANYLCFCLLIFLTLALFFKDQTFKFLASARFLSLSVHWLMFGGGFFLAFTQYSRNFTLGLNELFLILTLVISITLAWFSTLVENDLKDVRTDRISNRNRPLVIKLFMPKTYRQLGWFFKILSLIGAWLVSPTTLAYLTGYLLLAYIYNEYPMRLKRFPIIAGLTISWALIFIGLTGYTLISSGQTTETVPWELLLLILIGYTFNSPIKDFKDIKGDRLQKVHTLPALFGKAKAQKILAFTTTLSLAAPSLIFPNRLFFFVSIIVAFGTFLVFNNSKNTPWKLIYTGMLANFIVTALFVALMLAGEIRIN